MHNWTKWRHVYNLKYDTLLVDTILVVSCQYQNCKSILMHDWTKRRHVYILKYNTCTLNVNIS